jgi:PPOX class probable F420-dependent enzyme
MTILDESKPKHAAAQQRLGSEPIVWLTTVSPSGQPQSTPVWFLWADGEFLIYGAAKGPKNASIEANPQVSLHLEGNGQGSDNVIFEGQARIDPDGPRAEDVPGYLAKYQPFIDRYGWTAAGFSDDYPHVIRISPSRARIW